MTLLNVRAPHLPTLFKSLLAAIFVLFSQTAAAQLPSVECNLLNPVVGTGDSRTTYYTPTGILTNDTYQFMLFYQGADYPNCPDCADDIYVEHRSNNPVSLKLNGFSHNLILPNFADQTTRCGNPEGLCFYAGPSAFNWSSRYFLTAVKAADAQRFNEVIIGVSDDGYSWTWDTLLRTAPGINIVALSTQPTYIAGYYYSWGFAEIHSNGLEYLTPIRLRLFYTPLASRPADYVDRIEFRFGVGNWVPLTPWVRDHNAILSQAPDGDLWRAFGEHAPSLSYNGNWLLFLHNNDGRQLKFQTWTTDYTPLSEQYVYSHVRDEPSSYTGGDARVTPFYFPMWNYLYSAWSDANPNRSPAAPFAGEQIVVTSLCVN